jgi:hypothetical protein
MVVVICRSGSSVRRRLRHDHVRLERSQFACRSANAADIITHPAIVNANIAAVVPACVTQALHECCNELLPYRVIFGISE